MSEEIPEQEVKLKRITIKTEAGTRWFATVEDFLAWIQQQIELFGFLRKNLQNNHGEHNLQQRLQQSWSQLQQFAQKELKQVESNSDVYSDRADQLSSQFQEKLEAKQIFTSEAPFSDFMSQRKAEGDYLSAAVAIAYFLPENLTNFDLELAKALQKAIDWERGDYGKAESETQSLFNLREAWDEELARQTGDFQPSCPNDRI